jgi:hypothetical protein
VIPQILNFIYLLDAYIIKKLNVQRCRLFLTSNHDADSALASYGRFPIRIWHRRHREMSTFTHTHTMRELLVQLSNLYGKFNFSCV